MDEYKDIIRNGLFTMSEDKCNVKDEQLSLASGGGYLVDARGYEDQSNYAVLENQPVEDETGLHCPIEGCPRLPSL